MYKSLFAICLLAPTSMAQAETAGTWCGYADRIVTVGDDATSVVFLMKQASDRSCHFKFAPNLLTTRQLNRVNKEIDAATDTGGDAYMCVEGVVDAAADCTNAQSFTSVKKVSDVRVTYDF